MVDYHGFKLQRSASGMGTNITFTDWRGQTRTMLVLDAKYRNILPFSGNSFKPTALAVGKDTNASGGDTTILTCSQPIPDKQPLPDVFTNDAVFQAWSDTCVNDKTARENCDIWLRYKDLTSNDITGVPCVQWCREQLVCGHGCDMPNRYETIVIWVCGDKLDEMDRSGEAYSAMKLGYTSTGNKTYGRYQSKNGKQSDRLWSSSRSFSTGNFYAHYNGTCAGGQWPYYPYTAVPILEL